MQQFANILETKTACASALESGRIVAQASEIRDMAFIQLS